MGSREVAADDDRTSSVDEADMRVVSTMVEGGFVELKWLIEVEILTEGGVDEVEASVLLAWLLEPPAVPEGSSLSLM